MVTKEAQNKYNSHLGVNVWPSRWDIGAKSCMVVGYRTKGSLPTDPFHPGGVSSPRLPRIPINKFKKQRGRERAWQAGLYQGT